MFSHGRSRPFRITGANRLEQQDVFGSSLHDTV
jgi:hypothetical protein